MTSSPKLPTNLGLCTRAKSSPVVQRSNDPDWIWGLQHPNPTNLFHSNWGAPIPKHRERERAQQENLCLPLFLQPFHLMRCCLVEHNKVTKSRRVSQLAKHVFYYPTFLPCTNPPNPRTHFTLTAHNASRARKRFEIEFIDGLSHFPASDCRSRQIVAKWWLESRRVGSLQAGKSRSKLPTAEKSRYSIQFLGFILLVF